MKLTDKSLKDFNQWLLNNELTQIKNDGFNYRTNLGEPNNFNQLPFYMRVGVYQAFFDSVDIKISINGYNNSYWYDLGNLDIESGALETRAESWEKAIEKANEINNNQTSIIAEESIFSRMRKVFEWHKAK